MALNLISGLKGMTDPPMQQSAPYALGTPQPAGRAIVLNVTTAGTATLTFADGSSVTLNLQLGQISFPWSSQTVAAGTAVLTAFNLW